ncbi:MAG: type II toxin-antitoxin system VapC family toxin [Candidatus Aenigmarchaeota archaeon]|nr:type II toxin-antitoxin system VapC family toxin [Candidatus Aenigmarchaeota archaeon]
MKVVLDTSVIVEIDRKSEETIKIIKRLVDGGHDILVSTITISEILTGSYLRKDFKKALFEARRILGQFIWVDLSSEIAEKTAQYMAYLVSEGKTIEYQDVAIAATFRTTGSDYLLTLNKMHFESIPELKGKVYGPAEFRKVVR